MQGPLRFKQNGEQNTETRSLGQEKEASHLYCFAVRAVLACLLRTKTVCRCSEQQCLDVVPLNRCLFWGGLRHCNFPHPRRACRRHIGSGAPPSEKSRVFLRGGNGLQRPVVRVRKGCARPDTRSNLLAAHAPQRESWPRTFLLAGILQMSRLLSLFPGFLQRGGHYCMRPLRRVRPLRAACIVL